MPLYRVTVHRDYFVDIKAENEADAARFAEYYIGNPTDDSTPEDRRAKNFDIVDIEIATNDSITVEPINNE